VLAFFEVSEVYLQRWNLTGVDGKEKVYGSIP